MADIIDYLSEDDLRQYRRLTAIEGMLSGGHSDISLEDGAAKISEAWAFMGAIQRKYDIDPNDSFDVRVYDGALVRVD